MYDPLIADEQVIVDVPTEAAKIEPNWSVQMMKSWPCGLVGVDIKRTVN